MRLSLLAFISAAFLIAAVPASASPRIEPSFEDEGNPRLFAWAYQGTVLEWRACAPDGSPCERLPTSQPASYLAFHPGETATGTTFEADFDVDGTRSTLRTSPWQGRVTLAAPPVLTGEAVVGGTVRVGDGSWSGGWGESGEHSHRLLFACQDLTLGECWAIGWGEATLTERWQGWYLVGMAERHSAASEGSPALPALPYRLWPGFVALKPTLRMTAFSAPLGPVCCAPAPAAPVAAAPQAKPSAAAAVRRRALRRNGRIAVARVSCLATCSVKLTVSGGVRVLRRSLRVRGAKSLTIPVRHGKLRVRVMVNGKLLASGRTVAR